MLDKKSDVPGLTQLLLSCQDKLVIPAELGSKLAETGVVPSRPGDGRRHPRFRLRLKAAIQYRPTLKAIPRKEERHAVRVLDISCGGIGFLHSEQLFPCEQLLITLRDGSTKSVEVACCHRLGPGCYHIGTHVAS
jgi:hypothetical protein